MSNTSQLRANCKQLIALTIWRYARGVFKTLLKIYDRASCRNSQQILSTYCFQGKKSSNIDIGQDSKYASDARAPEKLTKKVCKMHIGACRKFAMMETFENGHGWKQQGLKPQVGKSFHTQKNSSDIKQICEQTVAKVKKVLQEIKAFLKFSRTTPYNI